MYKTVIVDDEFYARKRIADLLKVRDEFEITAECSTATEAIDTIATTKPDLVFMDIELKEMTGFEILEQVSEQHLCNIIFITAYNQYAIKAFEIYALDFLLKPFKAHRFNIALDRVLHKLEVEGFQNNFKNLLNNFGKNTSETEQCITKIPVKQGNKTILLQVSDIRYVCASSYYAEIFLDNKKLVLRESLKNLIKKLDDNSFVRIHRSTIINIEDIKELLHSDYNELDVKMQDNAVFRVSKSYKKAFLQKIGL